MHRLRYRARHQAYVHACRRGRVGRRIRPSTAVQNVRATKPRNDVVAAVAGDHVGECVAGAVDRRRPGQRQVFDGADGMNGVGQAEGDRRLDRVQAIATGFVDYVTAIVDHIGVVARTSEHRVGTGAAVDKVVAT